MGKITVSVSCTERETTVLACAVSHQIVKWSMKEVLLDSFYNPDSLLLFCLFGRGISLPITSIENAMICFSPHHRDYKSGMIISATINGGYWDEDLKKTVKRAFRKWNTESR